MTDTMKEGYGMITGIGHVAFVISDLERSLDFYCNKLGFRQAFTLDREGTPSPWIVYIQIAPGHFIELFPGGSGENEPRPLGYNHFCLLVDDLPATLKELAARGLEISGEPVQGLDNNWQYWLKDPDGNPIELMQIVATSPHAAADASWSGAQ
jgi:catechol 2,3-dioxygenase-like lactoylglutathione lyase family enzyme